MKFQDAIERLHATAFKVQLLSELLGASLGYFWWSYETLAWRGAQGALLLFSTGWLLGWGVGNILSRSYHKQARILMDYDR